MISKRELSYTESKGELNYKNLAAFHFTFRFIYFKILLGMIIIILIYSRGRDGSNPFGWSHQKKKVNDLYLHFFLKHTHYPGFFTFYSDSESESSSLKCTLAVTAAFRTGLTVPEFLID